MSTQNIGTIDYQTLEKISNLGLPNYIYKIEREVKSSNQYIYKTGAGFFFHLPSKDYKFFLTNNTILDQEFLEKEKKLNIINKDGNKIELNLAINRFKMTDVKLNFTIIEVLDEDNISNFFELDEFINSRDYKDEDIFTFDFPKGQNLQYLYGKWKGKNNEEFSYSCGVLGGSAIILKYNLKLIALHKGTYDQNNKINSAVPIKSIIEKMNFIKCSYNIDEVNVGKEIDIISKGYYSFSYNILDKMIMLIENEIKPIFLKYKFFNQGKYNVYFIVKDEYLYNIKLSYLFYQCSRLEKINFSLFNPKQVEIDKDISNMFYGCSLLKTIDLSFLNNCKLADISHLFYSCKSLEKIDLSPLNTSNVTNMSGIFSGCESLKELNLSDFNTSNTTNMVTMFSDCKSLNNLNLSSFNTSKVTNMTCMFSHCESLKELNLSNFNTSNTTNMGSMFSDCKSLKNLNLYSFNTNKVIDMSCMFSGCSDLYYIYFSSFNTSNTTNMCSMFNGCKSLNNLNLSSFNTSKVTNMSCMFSHCESLKELNLSNFNTSNTTNMGLMFSDCKSLNNLNLSSFNTSKVTDMSYMFWGCESLKELKLSYSFKTNNQTKIDSMFFNISSFCNISCYDDRLKKELPSCIIF